MEKPAAANPAPVAASPGRRRFLRGLLTAGLLTTPTGLYARCVEPYDLQVARVDLKLARWPADGSDLRIGHISDLHVDGHSAWARARHAVRLLMAQRPDAALITGDYITHVAHPWAERCAEALAPLTSLPHGAYAILGNHDYACGDADGISDQLRRAGIRVLRNQAVVLKGLQSVWLVGLESMSYHFDHVESALCEVPEEAVKLLLVHEPDYADRAPAGFALQFSGHSHGGQIRIPGMPPLHTPRYGRRYPEGLQRGPNHPVYTTRGVGMVGPHFRFCCPPEVGVLRIHAT